MAKRTGKTESSYVWTDDEVELLLSVTLQYSTKKSQENVDWESCYTKYQDIKDEFEEQYPDTEEAKQVGQDFPHQKGSATKVNEWMNFINRFGELQYISSTTQYKTVNCGRHHKALLHLFPIGPDLLNWSIDEFY